MKWSLDRYDLPLNTVWAIARSESVSKTIFFVQFSHKNTIERGEVAFNPHYGESAQLIEDQFQKIVDQLTFEPKNFNQVGESLKDLPVCPSLRCGLEMALVRWLAKIKNAKIHEIFKIDPPGQMVSSLSLPIMAIEELDEYISSRNLADWPLLKIKVRDLSSTPYVARILELTKGKICIDGNEGFQSAGETLEFIRGLKLDRIEFLEQPLKAGHKEQKSLKKLSPLQLMADESTLLGRVSPEEFDGINLKIMKSGGAYSLIQAAKEAKKWGLKIMLGCMIETGLGIHYASQLGQLSDYFDLDGMTFLKNDPFPLIDLKSGIITERLYSP